VVSELVVLFFIIIAIFTVALLIAALIGLVSVAIGIQVDAVTHTRRGVASLGTGIFIEAKVLAGSGNGVTLGGSNVIQKMIPLYDVLGNLAGRTAGSDIAIFVRRGTKAELDQNLIVHSLAFIVGHVHAMLKLEVVSCHPAVINIVIVFVVFKPTSHEHERRSSFRCHGDRGGSGRAIMITIVCSTTTVETREGEITLFGTLCKTGCGWEKEGAKRKDIPQNLSPQIDSNDRLHALHYQTRGQTELQTVGSF
jgi:hypothetical protein